MKKMMMCIAAAVAAFAAFAWPLPDEVVKAKPIVEELMSSRASLPPGEAADAAAELAAAAKTEAARFLLLRRAVEQYAKAGDDEKTAAAFQKLLANVKDVPPTVQERILFAAGRTLPVGKRAKTGALFKGVRALVWADKELAAARRLMTGANRDLPELHLRAGNALAVMGDWPKALDHLLGAKGKIAPVADHEINGTATADKLADAWWKASMLAEEEYVKSAYRLHAAELYRKALAANLLEGLSKNLAERRVAEVENEMRPPEAPKPVPRGNGSEGSAGGGGRLYCVVDLSAGPSADKYPVSYVDAEPKGGWTDEYKTTKLVLRRIEPGSFIMGKDQKDEACRVTLTKPFYCGVFEVTQKQYELVMGETPSKFIGDMRPVEKVSYEMIRGKNDGAKWPESSAVDSDSFLGKFRSRTGLDFDLPTEAQWEYACRAGTTSYFNNGGDSENDLKKLGRFAINQTERGWNESDADFARHSPDGKGGHLNHHTVVGSYLPNAWGLYDMHGNVWEWCLDWFDGLPKRETDPKGPSVGLTRILRGGGWDNGASLNTSFCQTQQGGADPSLKHFVFGFRIMLAEDVTGVPPTEPTVPPSTGTPEKPENSGKCDGLYCVIDLSAGPDADHYPVTYLKDAPRGGFNTDEYKTKKLVLRRIEPGTIYMGGIYRTTLTKPFYCGVFEVTQRQYVLVMGKNPSEAKGEMRPVEQVSYATIRGRDEGSKWPESSAVDSDSFMGKLQSRTGIRGFDLPTEAQWEYACRAGTKSAYNNGGKAPYAMKRLGRFTLNQKMRGHKESDADFAKHKPDGKGGYLERHTVVGSYEPNKWGLYDMHGNVWEWCRDWSADLSNRVTDPSGPSSGSERVRRGGAWDFHAEGCNSFERHSFNPSKGTGTIGFRIIRQLSE